MRRSGIEIGVSREYPASGQLSISNRGVLYIGGEGGKITAINLR